MSHFVCPITDARDVALVGGKARSLARVAGFGMASPPGFVLTTRAFDAFLDSNGLRLRIEKVLGALSAGASPAEVGRTAEHVKRLVAEVDLPLALREAMASAYADLGSGPVAVRSSAVGEDSQEASFAGQLDSTLDVEGPLALERAVRACWASYFNARAISYQRARGVALRGMGVVVQRMVRARAAGVTFTRAPGGGDDVIVEYCAGLGDALVSGAVDPGRVRIARKGLVTTREADVAEGIDPLSDDEARAVAFTALALEEKLGGPQDVEWAIDGSGELVILQSRPITVAAPREAPAGAGAARTSVVFSNANVNENYPDPITPLLYSIAKESYYHYFRNALAAVGVRRGRLERMEHALRHLVGVQGARLYYNLTNIYDVLKAAPMADRLTAWFDDFVGVDEPAPHTPVAAPKPARSALGELAEIGEIATALGWAVARYRTLPRGIARFEATIDAFAARSKPGELQAKPLAELRTLLQELLDIRFHRWTDASLADASAMVGYGALKTLLRMHFTAEEESALHMTLLKGLSNVVSSVPIARLWDLSRLVRADAELRGHFLTKRGAELRDAVRTPRFAAFGAKLDEYLEAWGFRGSRELMLTVPSFQERPEGLLDLLATYVAAEGSSPEEVIAAQNADCARETARVLRDLSRARVGKLPFVRHSHLVRLALTCTRDAIALRERARLKQALLYSRLRRIALAIGERLVAAGTLERAGDVFFLSYEEIDALLSSDAMFPNAVRDIVRTRRAEHERLSATQPPDTIVVPLGESWVPDAGVAPPANASRDVRLAGVATCGGRAAAPAAIVRDMSEAHLLEAGDVLVTRQTDPGWAPVFFLIRGLVMERGGMLSHGAIIAREFGIPAVVGVKDATRRIAPRQLVSIDGDAGHVDLR